MSSKKSALFILLASTTFSAAISQPPPPTETNTETATPPPVPNPPPNVNAAISAMEQAPVGTILEQLAHSIVPTTVAEYNEFFERLGISDANLPAFDVQDNQISFFNQLRHHFNQAKRSGFLGGQPQTPFQNVDVLAPTDMTRAARLQAHNQHMVRAAAPTAKSMDDQLKATKDKASIRHNKTQYMNKHLWAQFLYGARERRSPRSVATYQSTAVGLMFGYDLIVRAQEMLGIFLAYQRTDQDKYARGENEVRGFTAGLYGNITHTISSTFEAYASLMGSAQISRHKDERKVQQGTAFLRASTNHRTFNALASGEVGVAINTPYAQVKPYAQASLTSIFKARHTERGADNAALTVHHRRMYLGASEIGTEVSRDFFVKKAQITPALRFGWVHKKLIKGKKFRVSYPNDVASYMEIGSSRRKHLYSIEANASAKNTEGLGASLYVNGQYGQAFRSNEFGFRITKVV